MRKKADYSPSAYKTLRTRAGYSRPEFCALSGLALDRIVSFERGNSNSADVALVYLALLADRDDILDIMITGRVSPEPRNSLTGQTDGKEEKNGGHIQIFRNDIQALAEEMDGAEAVRIDDAGCG